MDLQPFANTLHRCFVRIGRRMWTVKNPAICKQLDANTGPFSLGNFGTQSHEKRFNITPLDAAPATLRSWGKLQSLRVIHDRRKLLNQLR